MSKATQKAWEMLAAGEDIEAVRVVTGLSRAVLDAMAKDVARQSAEEERRRARREGR